MKHLIISNKDEMSIAQSIAKDVRDMMVSEHGTGVNLAGYCIEASNMIVDKLHSQGIEAHTVEGWCIYDDDHYGSDCPYDAHTWVEAVINGTNTYIDVTADQFNPGMFSDNKFPAIIIGQKPENMVYDEPTYLIEE